MLFLGYALFFGGGTLARQLRHGPLAARSDDAQRASKGGRFALAIFIVAIPFLHWLVGLPWRAQHRRRRIGRCLITAHHATQVHLVSTSHASRLRVSSSAGIEQAIWTSVPVTGGMTNLGFSLILGASALNIWAAASLGAGLPGRRSSVLRSFIVCKALRR